jgi:hypothetical protein
MCEMSGIQPVGYSAQRGPKRNSKGVQSISSGIICRMTDARTRLNFFAERALKYFPATNHLPVGYWTGDPGSKIL